MEKLWHRAVMIFAFSMTVVAAGYFLTGLNDQLAQQVQSGAVDNMSVVVLDAGHGGMDGGATAAGVRECEINLSIAQKARDFLTLMGYRVVMTRENDTLLADEGAGTVRAQKRSDLKNRLEIMAGTPGAVGVSIHQNHFSQSYVHGAQVFYGKADGSRELAERIQKNIATYLQTDNKRKIKEADSSLFILNNNRANPSVMVECGFLSNPKDMEDLQQEKYQGMLAFLITVSLMEYEHAPQG
ncbi:MAG: N-acetylmuramoyl-L-alanine amidase [Angelakisella sp.]